MRPGTKISRYGAEFLICEPVPALYKSSMVQNVRERGHFFAVNTVTGALTIFTKSDVENAAPSLSAVQPHLHLKAGSYEWPISLQDGLEHTMATVRTCMNLARSDTARVTYRNKHRSEWCVDYDAKEKVLEQFFLDIKRKLSN